MRLAPDSKEGTPNLKRQHLKFLIHALLCALFLYPGSSPAQSVISGVFYVGLGDQFDAGKLEAYPPGAVIVLPGDTAYFHWAKSGEYITQVNAIGPLGLNLREPEGRSAR
jgi:hypothetical protein